MPSAKTVSRIKLWGLRWRCSPLKPYPELTWPRFFMFFFKSWSFCDVEARAWCDRAENSGSRAVDSIESCRPSLLMMEPSSHPDVDILVFYHLGRKRIACEHLHGLDRGLIWINQTRRRNSRRKCGRGGDIGGSRRSNAVRSSLSPFVKQGVCRPEIENFLSISLMFFALEKAALHLVQHELLRNLRSLWPVYQWRLGASGRLSQRSVSEKLRLWRRRSMSSSSSCGHEFDDLTSTNQSISENASSFIWKPLWSLL